MAQRKISVPRVICELLRWQTQPDKHVAGTVFNSRVERDNYDQVNGEVKSFHFTDAALYPKSIEDDPYFLFRLINGHYVKCYVSERAEWTEALGALLSKPEDPA